MSQYKEQFHAGTLTDGWRWFGAHPEQQDGQDGWEFRVWAPKAQAISVVGDFNNWDTSANPLEQEDQCWSGFIPDLKPYTAYKYAVKGVDGEVRMKADPYGFHTETRPGTASKLYDISGFEWTDDSFHKYLAEHPVYHRPLNIYEVHLGSWKRRDNGDFYDYRDLATELAAYVKEMGYNAIELLPVTEHPLDASWGYQCTGYFAPTSRYGQPKDFMWFVNHMHENGISVLLDWVPSHFCKDAQGLYQFDGGCCYEYSDPNKWEHASWGTRVFDYGRPEVISFLYSSARYWLEEYHIDGLRVDAVASMLYLDYDRQGGAWTPNVYGGHENLEAIEFLRGLNKMAFSVNPNVLMIAEESTAWPMVTKPADMGGLGFNLKWNMGWMNDMCHYLKLDPWFRQDHHKDITFSMMYAFSENYVLPMSHDEVVHMKGSIVNKMATGNSTEDKERYRTQLRGLRGFYSYLLAHPGKKLMFMGAELGQWREWDDSHALDWFLLDQNEENRQTQLFFKEANAFYQSAPTLWEEDFDWHGFEWLVVDDNHNNVVVFVRRDSSGNELICAINFSPNEYSDYRFGVPGVLPPAPEPKSSKAKKAKAADTENTDKAEPVGPPPKKQYKAVFNSDAKKYGGAGFGDTKAVKVEAVESHGRPCSIAIKIPAFGAVFYQGDGVYTPKKPRKPRAATAKTPVKKATVSKEDKKAAALKNIAEAKKRAASKNAAEAKKPAAKRSAKKKEPESEE